MQQLFLELEKDKICSEPKEKAKEKLCVGDEIRIITLRGETKKALSYSGRKLIHRKAKVIKILGTERDPYQGVRVKFGKDGFEKKNFVYAFYPDEIKKVRRKN